MAIYSIKISPSVPFPHYEMFHHCTLIGETRRNYCRISSYFISGYLLKHLFRKAFQFQPQPLSGNVNCEYIPAEALFIDSSGSSTVKGHAALGTNDAVRENERTQREVKKVLRNPQKSCSHMYVYVRGSHVPAAQNFPAFLETHT